ncbi:MAG: glycine cleavage system protein R [Proteobacteria bacterium]|nr:glycine cleavage system protein R [Pseudomonadota bacterium]
MPESCKRTAREGSKASLHVTCGVKWPASILSLSALGRRLGGPPPDTNNLSDTAARPTGNENHLLINAYATHPDSPLLPVSRRISDSGCNLVDARLSTVGRDVSVSMLAVGSWDAIAKLEAMLSRLEREDGYKLNWYRTGPKPVQSNLIPYIVEVVAADKPGILFQLADFFDRQSITVENLHCARYRAMQTGAEMFTAQLTIGVPADMHIAGLRDDFLEFSDRLNLDAIMDPMKF